MGFSFGHSQVETGTGVDGRIAEIKDSTNKGGAKLVLVLNTLNPKPIPLC